MTVGILTFCNTNNYGAELQAYALRKTIEGMGYEVELIDYRCPSVTAGEQPHLSDPVETFKHPRIALYRLGVYPGLVKRSRAFERFRREHQRYGPHIIEPRELEQRYETVVVGSDQVWNPEITMDDGMFLLEGLGDKGPRRVAYAASFGFESISDAWAERCRRALPAFAALGVREHEGAKIIESATGRIAETVLDPTLLLNRASWESVAAPPMIERRYVFTYIVQERSSTIRAARAIARYLGIELVAVDCGGMFCYRGCRTMSHVSPEEFLSLVRHADLVVTSSFHGLALSLSLGTEARFVLSSHVRNKNSRICSLARTAHVETWEIDHSGDAGDAFRSKHVNFDAIDVALSRARQASLSFLEHALQGGRCG